MKCLDLLELIEYSEFALDDARMEQIKQHLESCQACQEKYEGLEQMTTALRTHFRSQTKVKGEDCPDDSVWEKYVKKQMAPQEESELKEHLAECDYCFDVAAKLFKTQLDEAAVANIQTPQSFQERVEVKWPRPGVLTRWLQILREHLFAPRLIAAYATAVILLLAFFIGRPYILHKGDNIVKTPLQQIQIGQQNYTVFNLSLKSSPDLKQPDEMPQLPLAALSSSQHRQMLAFLSVQLANALKAFFESADAEHLEHILTELETQEIKPLTREIEFVIIETSLRSQIQNDNYKEEQRLLVSFPEETILKIQAAQ
ncbi:hypothetical protein H8E77_42230 [bacterium]|nr:hypothetical protein [bacterium]